LRLGQLLLVSIIASYGLAGCSNSASSGQETTSVATSAGAVDTATSADGIDAASLVLERALDDPSTGCEILGKQLLTFEYGGAPIEEQLERCHAYTATREPHPYEVKARHVDGEDVVVTLTFQGAEHRLIDHRMSLVDGRWMLIDISERPPSPARPSG
jgi:hypothetical protein